MPNCIESLVFTIKMTISMQVLANPLIITTHDYDMVTRSDQILKIEKSHMSKSKSCFEILE